MEKQLLTDEQMSHFISKGYLVLHNSIPEEKHDRVLRKLTEIYAEEGNPNNNIIPRVPEIADFMATPEAKGALSGLLGDDYCLHPHRHCHLNVPGQKVAQHWHKDSYDGGYMELRSHRPWWLLVLYYTQDVSVEMGPTAIISGSQYYESFPGDDRDVLLPAGKAGTMVFIHYDLWHRASLNTSDIDRFMIKFVYIRRSEPSGPTWNHARSELPLPDHAGDSNHRVIWNDIWNWYRGMPGPSGRASSADMNRWMLLAQEQSASARQQAADELGLMGEAAAPAIPLLRQLLDDAAEPVALNASYALGNMGEEGTKALLDALTHGSETASQRSVYGLQSARGAIMPFLESAMAHADEQRQLHIICLLGFMGTVSELTVPALIQRLQHPDEKVVRNAAEVLGLIQKPGHAIVSAVAALLESEPSAKVAAVGALTLLRIAQYGEYPEMVPALQRTLRHSNRYASGYAIEALAHIRTGEALDVMIDFYRTARWCPSQASITRKMVRREVIR